MSSSQATKIAGSAKPNAGRPTDAHMLAMGKLSYLAAFCPRHRKYPAEGLARLFFPAINADCVRFFENESGAPVAALIWARLTDAAVHRMVHEKTPPGSDDWAAGNNLWFLDLIAPFGHGAEVARHIARNPPAERFFFARIGPDGAVRKVVEGDATRGRRGLVQAMILQAEVA